MLAMLLAAATVHAQSDLPRGVIAPYRWGTRPIPVSGKGAPGTQVVDAAVTDAMRANGIVGCGVCICQGDATVYYKGFGYAELPDKPFLPTTATRCGSLAKPITSLCALALMDQGKLDLDERVLPILSSMGLVPTPVDDRVNRITVRELMDHTSGLPSFTTYTSWRPGRNLIEALHLTRKPTSADVVLDGLSTAHLIAEPGERFEYANANFVILARVIEARSQMSFSDFLNQVAMPKYGVYPGEIFVSKDQDNSNDPFRGDTEAAYYQTSAERYCSFLPGDAAKGRVFGEAYKGYSTECSDGAGGIAISAQGMVRILARLRSPHGALSPKAMQELLTPPEHYRHESGFDPSSSTFYSKGFEVRYAGDVPWFSHGGMTNHCGGRIGYNAGYSFAIVSNWNAPQSPYVDQILDRAVAEAVAKIGR